MVIRMHWLCFSSVSQNLRITQFWSNPKHIEYNTHCVCGRHGGHSVELGRWLCGVSEGGLALWHRHAVSPGGLGQEVQAGNLLCQRVPGDKQRSLFCKSGFLRYWRNPVSSWLHSPVFGVNDGVDERVVDGRRFGYNGRNSFGVGIEDASITEKEWPAIFSPYYIVFHGSMY